MILYSNDRKLLRDLRKVQQNETSFLFISADYTFLRITLSVFPSKSQSRNMFSQHCNSSIANSRLSRLKYKGRLFHSKTIFASITPVVSTSK